MLGLGQGIIIVLLTFLLCPCPVLVGALALDPGHP